MQDIEYKKLFKPSLNMTYDEIFNMIHRSNEDAQCQGVKVLKRDIRDWVNDEGDHLTKKERVQITNELWNAINR